MRKTRKQSKRHIRKTTKRLNRRRRVQKKNTMKGGAGGPPPFVEVDVNKTDAENELTKQKNLHGSWLLRPSSRYPRYGAVLSVKEGNTIKHYQLKNVTDIYQPKYSNKIRQRVYVSKYSGYYGNNNIHESVILNNEMEWNDSSLYGPASYATPGIKSRRPPKLPLRKSKKKKRGAIQKKTRRLKTNHITIL